jgi:hypothetical protein
MRVELFVKSGSQLTSFLSLVSDRSAQLCSSSLQGSNVYSSFNIPNKAKDDNLLPYAERILSFNKDADICIHYSLKNQRFRTMDEACTGLIQYIQRSNEVGVKEILLVSGSGDKRSVNSLSCLEQLRIRGYSKPKDIRLSVAFNPYCLSDEELEKERIRLRQKLETGFVETVYLQFGTDISLLEEGLAYLKQLQ